MTTLEQIEKTVEELGAREFEAFSRWFEALQARRWDSQIEAAAKDGKLDTLTAAAVAAFRDGRTKPL